MRGDFYTKEGFIKKIFIVIAALILAMTGIFFAWANDTYCSMETISSNDLVEVETGDYIVYKPIEKEVSKGFIFYLGAKVEPDAYSKLCSKIAEEGYLVVIAPMTLDLAILSPNKAEDIIKEYSNIESWAIGGHSLGGVMAANYAVKDEKIDGLIFYASYPQGDELQDSDLKVLSMYGSNDGVAKLDKVKDAILPEESEIIEIKGGNHAGFGTYGEQSGDNKADISNDEQINEAADYTIKFLNNL